MLSHAQIPSPLSCQGAPAVFFLFCSECQALWSCQALSWLLLVIKSSWARPSVEGRSVMLQLTWGESIPHLVTEEGTFAPPQSLKTFKQTLFPAPFLHFLFHSPWPSGAGPGVGGTPSSSKNQPSHGDWGTVRGPGSFTWAPASLARTLGPCCNVCRVPTQPTNPCWATTQVAQGQILNARIPGGRDSDSAFTSGASSFTWAFNHSTSTFSTYDVQDVKPYVARDEEHTAVALRGLGV